MSTALLRRQLESATGARLGFREWIAPEIHRTGIAEIDSIGGGVPRGCLTELVGPVSSGRTTVMLSLISQATRREEYCALVDATDAFDPVSASAAGADLSRLLWIRCGGDAERALKATDLLLQAGGFGLVVMDLGDVPRMTARRISMTSWFRLRKAVEHTPAAFVVLEREPNAKTCASLVLEFRQSGIHWSGEPRCSRLLRGMRADFDRTKPILNRRASFLARVPGCSGKFIC
jgi:recombination protein RecA